jgi:hypothetical protein
VSDHIGSQELVEHVGVGVPGFALGVDRLEVSAYQSLVLFG